MTVSSESFSPLIGCCSVSPFCWFFVVKMTTSDAFYCLTFCSFLLLSSSVSPHGLAFTWWGCCGLCFWHKPAELAHFFLFCFCVYFCLCGPFNCISFHKFFQQLSAFSFCSSSPKSALSALSTIYLFLKVSLSPDVIPSGWHCLEHQLTNSSSVIDSCGRVSLPVQRRQQSWLSFTGHQGTPELVVEWSFACPNLKMLFFTEGADL